MKLNINTDAVIRYSAKLERMGRSDLPVAVRSALNDAAFDLKTKNMPKSANRFINRSPNFFKANSRYEKATGFRISGMKSTVGFMSDKLKGKTNFAVKDLEQQEKGGKIGGKSFIPTKQARKGNSVSGAVKPSNRTTKITNIVHAKKMKAKTGGAKFIKAIHEAKRGGYVLSQRVGLLFRVDSLVNNKFKLTPVYSYAKNRKVTVQKTNFMKDATLKTADNMEDYFIKQAKKRIFK